jgi:GC-rich sequence DNA-binding factor
MSDAPVIFKRSKFKANQRAREQPQQNAQEQQLQSTEDEPSPSALASKIKNKAKQRAKPKTSLSFGVEEEVSQQYIVSSALIFNFRRGMKKPSRLRNPASVRS